MRLSDLQEEVTSLFKEHPLSDLPHDILELLLDWYNINSYGIQLPKLISQSNSLLAQLKQKGYIVNYDGSEDILSVTKSRDKYTSDGDDIRGRILNALYRDGIDEGMGGSSGGGTAGSAGAGGSSLGLPYPSTYEEEYNKF